MRCSLFRLGGLVIAAVLSGCSAATAPDGRAPDGRTANCVQDDYAFDPQTFAVGDEARVYFERERGTVVGVEGLPPDVEVWTPQGKPGMATYGKVKGPAGDYAVKVSSILYWDGEGEVEIKCSMVQWTVTAAREGRRR